MHSFCVPFVKYIFGIYISTIASTFVNHPPNKERVLCHFQFIYILKWSGSRCCGLHDTMMFVHFESFLHLTYCTGTCSSSWLLFTLGEPKGWRRSLFEKESKDEKVAVLYLSSRGVLPITWNRAPETPCKSCWWYTFKFMLTLYLVKTKLFLSFLFHWDESLNRWCQFFNWLKVLICRCIPITY